MPPPKKRSTTKNEPDYLMKYLESEFSSLHQKLDNNELSVKELNHIVETMRIQEANKCANCENTREIKLIKVDVDEFKFIKKYKNVFIIAVAVSALAICLSIIDGLKSAKSMLTEQKQQIQINH